MKSRKCESSYEPGALKETKAAQVPGVGNNGILVDDEDGVQLHDGRCQGFVDSVDGEGADGQESGGKERGAEAGQGKAKEKRMKRDIPCNCILSFTQRSPNRRW